MQVHQKKTFMFYDCIKKIFVQGHKDRLNFTADIMDHFKNKIDYYGFGIKELKNKRDAIDPYLFSIAIENSQRKIIGLKR